MHRVRSRCERPAAMLAREYFGLVGDDHRLHIWAACGCAHKPRSAAACPSRALVAPAEVLPLAEWAGLPHLGFGGQGGVHLLLGQGVELQDALPETPPGAGSCSCCQLAGAAEFGITTEPETQNSRQGPNDLFAALCETFSRWGLETSAGQPTPPASGADDLLIDACWRGGPSYVILQNYPISSIRLPEPIAH